ncbi:MAG TPA: hypothetical protein VMF62_12425 [Acetobacteraceae bacterium]|nr:hypothetical protein [Acetobacteraceae bacterium]
MNTSDTVLDYPVELRDSELDTVSAGLKSVSPIVVLEDDIKRLVATILSDLEPGGTRAYA